VFRSSNRDWFLAVASVERISQTPLGYVNGTKAIVLT
jgi:hypothetical protein